MDGERLRDSLFYKRLERKFRGSLLRASQEGAILCIPQTASLVTTVLTQEDVENHILVPAAAARGEWVSLNGKACTVTSGEVVAGAGYRRRVAARILSTEKVTVTFTGKEVRRLTPASAAASFGAGMDGGGSGRASARRLSAASTASGPFLQSADLFDAAEEATALPGSWAGASPEQSSRRDRAASLAASAPTSPLKMAVLRAGHDPLTGGTGALEAQLEDVCDDIDAALPRALAYGEDEAVETRGAALEGAAGAGALALPALAAAPAEPASASSDASCSAPRDVDLPLAAGLVAAPSAESNAGGHREEADGGGPGGERPEGSGARVEAAGCCAADSDDSDRTTVTLADWLQRGSRGGGSVSGAATPREAASDGSGDEGAAPSGRGGARASASASAASSRRPSQPGTPRRTFSGRESVASPSRASSGRRFPSLFDAASTPVPQPAAPLTVTITAYFLSQPLEGGLAAASSIDDIDHGAVMRYVAMLKTSPETEAVFTRLEKVVDWARKRLSEVVAAVEAGLLPAMEHSLPVVGPFRRRELPVGPTAVCLYQVEDPERGITSPAITAIDVARDQLRLECAAAVDCLLCTSFYAGEAPASRPGTRRLLMQVLESWCMEQLAEPALRALRLGGWDLAVGKLAAVLRARAPLSPLDTGIKEEFICNLNPVVASLGLLQTAATPLEKLHCLRDTSLLLQKCVERHLEARHVDLADVEFATDDILVMLLHAIVKGHPLHATADLPLHLDYITRFNFAATPDELSRSRLGYYLANFQQCLIFFDDEAERLAQAEAEARPRPRAATGSGAGAALASQPTLVRVPSTGGLATPDING